MSLRLLNDLYCIKGFIKIKKKRLNRELSYLSKIKYLLRTIPFQLFIVFIFLGSFHAIVESHSLTILSIIVHIFSTGLIGAVIGFIIQIINSKFLKNK